MNSLKNKCLLSFYNEITRLGSNPQRDITLVKHQFTDKIYVKKVLDNCDKNVLLSIKQNPHKNICEIYELFEDEKKTVVIEEFINGSTLEEVLQSNGTMSEAETIQIIISVCEGLSHLHSLNPPVIHRDIKPSNVMLTNDHIVKIIDFNASRNYKATASSDTVILGTAGFAPPEQFGFQETDARSDVYSVGVLMNYLLTGKHPKDELYQGRLKNSIEKCVQLAPEKRYKNTEQLEVALQRVVFPDTVQRRNKKYFLPIPGFRSGKLLKMIVAVLGYISIAGAVAFTQNPSGNAALNIVNKVVTALVFLSWVALFTNYFNITEHIPLFNTNNKSKRVGAYCLYAVLIPVAGVLLFGTIQYILIKKF